MKTDPKARYQGYGFFFREGFCWIDVNSTYLKSRLKNKGVFDVLSMSLFTMVDIPDWYYVCLINSDFISFYVDNFINNTSHFQINDARQLIIVIPTLEQLMILKKIFEEAVKIKKEYFAGDIDISTSTSNLNKLQNELNRIVKNLYSI